MPKRRNENDIKSELGEYLSYIFLGTVIYILAVIKAGFKNPWMLLILFGFAIFIVWFYRRQKKRLEQDPQWTEQERDAEIERNKQEILSHKSEWGEEICKWIIENRNLEEGITGRELKVLRHLPAWGEEFCKVVLKMDIVPDMTEDMVKLSIGEPTAIDNEQITRQGENLRFIYKDSHGVTSYIWFKDGKVTRYEFP